MAKEVKATVLTYSKATGEGTLKTSVGHEFAFSAWMADTESIFVGDEASVNLCLDSRGKRRVDRVVIVQRPARTVSFSAAVTEIKSLGFLCDWSTEHAHSEAGRLWDEIPKRIDAAQASLFLRHYYGMGPTDRAVSEGFLAHDWRFGQETDNIVAEFVRALRCPPATQIRNGAEGIVVRDDNDQTIEVVVTDMTALARFFQGRFEALKSSRRLICLETDGDWLAYAVREEANLPLILNAQAVAATLV